MNNQFVLVEDRPEEAELIVLALDKTNFDKEFVWLKDGQEALDYFINPTQPQIDLLPKLIILDLNLPKVGGLEVLKKLRQKESLNGVPIVVLTTSNRNEDKKQAYDFGANSYLVKSPDFSKFSDTVTEMTGYWLAYNCVPGRTN